MTIKTKLSDISLSRSTTFFNSLEDNSDVCGDEHYKWDVLLKSFKKYGYSPRRFSEGWIRVTSLEDWNRHCSSTPGGWRKYHDTNTIKKFLLLEGHHRVAICKYLYGDDYVIEVMLVSY